MMCSNQMNDKGFLKCKWTSSLLYRSHSNVNLCTFLPRSAFVCPTSGKLSGYSVPVGSVEKERKQHFSGEAMYKSLMESLLMGLKLKDKDLLYVREEMAYDGTLAKALLALRREPPAGLQVPNVACSMLVSQGSKMTVNGIAEYLEQVLHHTVKEIAGKGCFRLKDYCALPPLTEGTKPPELDASVFQHTYPVLDRRVLQVRESAWETFVDNEVVGKRAEEWLKEHNATYNPDGQFHKEGLKRQAEEPTPEEATATTIDKWEAGDPETREEGKAKFGADWLEELPTGAPGVFAAVAKGKLFLYSAEDTVVSVKDPLNQFGLGTWLEGAALQKAQKGKHKQQLVPFTITSGDALVKIVVKGQLKNKFPEEPMPFHKFLFHLEGEHIVSTTLVNHKIDREDAAAGDAMPAKFKIAVDVETAYEPSQEKDGDNKFWSLRFEPAAVASSKWATLVLSLEYHKNVNQLVPEFPWLHVATPVRVFKDKLARIL